MSPTHRVPKFLALGTLFVLPWLMGAQGNGCGDVIVGEETCVSSANPESICMPSCAPEGTPIADICETSPKAYCYNNFGICEPSADGCGWQPSQTLTDCLNNIGEGCVDDASCPKIELCLLCPDGTCGESKCVNGGCQVSCDPEPLQCSTTDDCLALPWPADCELCADGSCAAPTCNNGKCERTCAGGQPECKSVDDCVFAPAICELCADGSCAKGDCVNGKCDTVCKPPKPGQCITVDDCPTVEFCVACGDGNCAIMTCDNGTCGFKCPNEQQCQSPDDCVFPAICEPCPDGSCAGGICANGKCEMVCPN